MFKRYHLLILGLACLITAAVMAVGIDKADAAQPYGGCKEAYQAPHSAGARDCRRDGWLVSGRYVVSPRNVLRYYNLPSCEYEDGSGPADQRHGCGWNVTEGDGNGRGLVYIVLPHNRGTVYLKVCDSNGCHRWRR